MEERSRNTKITRLIIGDIDGVIADCSERLKFIQNGEKNWDKFYGAEMANDEYIRMNGKLLKELSYCEPYQLLFLTGRPERTHELTRLWLNEHLGITDYWITCRKDGDHRKSPVVKAEMLVDFITNYGHLCDDDMRIYIFDDDPENLKAMAKALLDNNIYLYETFCVGTKRF